MANKNDLSGLKIKPKNTLLNLQTTARSVNTQATAGRKPKPVTEKQSELIGLRFTPSELEHIKLQAGLVPVATYLKNELITKAGLFTD